MATSGARPILMSRGYEERLANARDNSGDKTVVRPPTPPTASSPSFSSPPTPTSLPRPSSGVQALSRPPPPAPSSRPSRPPPANTSRHPIQMARASMPPPPPPPSSTPNAAPPFAHETPRARPVHAEMTTVRPMSSSAPTLRAHELTRVRPPGMEIAPARSSGRLSVPAPGEINRAVRRKRNGLVALYWSAGIVAMLTAGGIVIAMIARGDADALIHRQGMTPVASAQVVVAVPKSAVPTPPVYASPPPALPGAVAAEPAPAANAEAPTAAKEKKNTAIPGAKPGQIVDLQLWKNRQSKDGTAANTGSPAPQPEAAKSPSGNTARGGAAAAPAAQSNISTPDNDPAVRLARDQLESTFK